MSRLIAFALLSLGFMVMMGCSSGPVTGTVTGIVEYDGKPASGGFVSMISKSGGAPITSVIETDGSYMIKDILAGECLVSVDSPPASETSGQIIKEMGKSPNKGPAPAPAQKVFYPARYAKFETSKLNVTVKPQKEGNTVYNLTLTK